MSIFHACAALCEPATVYAEAMVYEWIFCIHPTSEVPVNGDKKRPAHHKIVEGYKQPGAGSAVSGAASVAAGEALREFEWLARGNDDDRERFEASVKDWARWFAVRLAPTALLTEAGRAMKAKILVGEVRAPEIWVPTTREDE